MRKVFATPLAALAALALAAPVFEAAAEERAPGSSREDPFRVDPFEGSGRPAPTDPDELRARAAELAEAGQAALGARAYDAAAQQLQESYTLVPQPALLLPLAEALERIGHYAAAAERLELFLDTSEDIDAQQRLNVDLQLRTLRRRFAQVTIRTVPDGAAVSLDGRPLGRTPLSPFSLDHGNYRVEASLEGYRDLASDLAVAGGRPVGLDLTFQPVGRPGRLAWSRSLEVGLWTSVALAAALAVSAIVTGGIAADDYGRLASVSRYDHPLLDEYGGLLYATYGLSAGATAATAAAVALWLVRSLSGGR